jgi:glycosyltransferase involved in cell wall biosynthesis
MSLTKSAAGKILIIDSGMKNLGGHNFSYTRAVQNALAQKSFASDVLANKALPDELAQSSGYQPTFTYGAYDFPPPAGIGQVIKHINTQSEVYAGELAQFFENKLSDYAAVFCHTIGDFELVGWNKFLSRHKLNSQLMLLLRTTPGFSRMNFVKRKFHPYHRIRPHYAQKIYAKLKNRFTLLTDSESLTEDYKSVYKHHIVTLPIPINKYFLEPEADGGAALDEFKNRYGLNADGGLCVGYMGDAREVKGFYLLPEMVKSVLEKTENVRFAFQCPKPMGGEMPRGVAEMNEIAERARDRVTLVSERLSEADYANMYRCLDAVLIPYPSIVYREATSGIFAEAVALGKPTLVTEDSWMSHELEKFGGGLEIKRDDSRDLTEKMFELIENYDAYAENARAFSGKWRKFNNSHTLAEMLIAEIEN